MAVAISFNWEIISIGAGGYIPNLKSTKIIFGFAASVNCWKT